MKRLEHVNEICDDLEVVNENLQEENYKLEQRIIELEKAIIFYKGVYGEQAGELKAVQNKYEEEVKTNLANIEEKKKMNEEVQKLREQKLDLEQQNANLKLKIEKREDGKEFMRAYEEDKEHTDEILIAHEEEEPLENRNIKP